MISVPQSQIDNEIAQGYKPHALDSGLMSLPMNELGDREFEVLVYSLVEAKIQSGDYEGFDQIVLMKGVGERGRDCQLYRQGQVAGLIQCKKLQKKMSRSEVMEEIVKFLMFAIAEEELMPSPEVFEYHIYASGGYFEPAVKLLSAFSAESRKEVEHGGLGSIIKSLKEKYATFRAYDEIVTFKCVAKVLEILNVRFYTGVDLNLALTSYPVIISKFFRTMPVLDSTKFEEIITQKFEESGIKFLTDENLSLLYKRLTSVPTKFQVSLGKADFYGYSENYFKFLGRDGFSELIKKISDLRLFLDLKAHDYAMSLLMPTMVDKLTKPYVETGIILPYTLNVIAQYLTKRILPAIMCQAAPDSVIELMHPYSKHSKKALMNEVLESCLDSSRRFFAGDFSAFPDPDPYRESRISLFHAMHDSCNNDVELKERFWLDLPKIMPVVDEVEQCIVAEVPKVRTVVVNDMAYFDNPERLGKVLDALNLTW